MQASAILFAELYGVERPPWAADCGAVAAKAATVPVCFVFMLPGASSWMRLSHDPHACTRLRDPIGRSTLPSSRLLPPLTRMTA